MISEEMYNRICQLFFLEETRLNNLVIDKMNYIFRYTPTEATAYIDLIKAKASKDYFDKYVFRMLDWLMGFVQDS